MEEMGGRSDWQYYIGRSCLCLDFLRNLVFLLIVSFSGVNERLAYGLLPKIYLGENIHYSFILGRLIPVCYLSGTVSPSHVRPKAGICMGTISFI